ncbi:efflux transporter outer membrane subunit [Hyphomicrobium sp. MC1]|uniref:efflux transporter outer membrane subunit n=1 Tax=Hyphomicrobium sp. (strain MC1) TaxID=717785 RepID=UPI0006821A25
MTISFIVRSWRRIRLRMALLMLPGFLAGCAVGPDYQTPLLLLPTQWGSAKQAQRNAPRLNNWWYGLHDATLNDLMEQAVAGNLDVATAKANIREARATLHQARGTLFPVIDGVSSSTWNEASSDGSTSGVSTFSRQFEKGFDSSWEIDVFGANRRGLEAAVYGSEAADEQLRATLLTLVGDVASYYVDVRGYQERIALAKRTAASQRSTAGLTRAKFQAGTSSAVDLANAEGLAAGTEANIPELQISLAESIHRLSVLTGQPPSALSAGLNKAAPVPSARLNVPAGIPADVLLNRPDVRLAERQLAQYTAKIGQAEAARYPSVSLTGDISTSATHFGDLFKGSTISWAFGPSVTVPIFHGGQLKAAVELAEAERDTYFIAYRSSVLTALEDVENSLVGLSQERVRNRKLSESAKAYRQATTLSRALYQSGSTSFLDVLDAERSLYSAEDTLIESNVSIVKDYISLNKALGGGWNKPVDASQPEIIDRNTGPHFAYRS